MSAVSGPGRKRADQGEVRLFVGKGSRDRTSLY